MDLKTKTSNCLSLCNTEAWSEDISLFWGATSLAHQACSGDRFAEVPKECSMRYFWKYCWQHIRAVFEPQLNVDSWQPTRIVRHVELYCTTVNKRLEDTTTVWDLLVVCCCYRAIQSSCSLWVSHAYLCASKDVLASVVTRSGGARSSIWSHSLSHFICQGNSSFYNSIANFTSRT